MQLFNQMEVKSFLQKKKFTYLSIEEDYNAAAAMLRERMKFSGGKLITDIFGYIEVRYQNIIFLTEIYSDDLDYLWPNYLKLIEAFILRGEASISFSNSQALLSIKQVHNQLYFQVHNKKIVLPSREFLITMLTGSKRFFQFLIDVTGNTNMKLQLDKAHS